MCYAIPGEVVEIKGRIAVVDYFGEKRKAINEFSDAKVGEYVYAQGGFIVQKISKKDALMLLEGWKDLFFQLKQQDQKTLGENRKVRNVQFEAIIQKALNQVPLSKKELLQLLKTEDQEEQARLFNAANALRQQNLENSCCVHGIIEFSNYCRNNCFYCGIRADNTKQNKYRMTVEEIVLLADHAVNTLGFKALVLQSGEDLWYTTDMLVEIILKIKQKCGVLLFMSVGGRDADCYTRMYDAGARGILLRFETSNPELYAKIHSGPKSNFQERINLLKHAAALGYIIVTGSMVGLPGQSDEDIVNDLLLAKSLKAEMHSFGPFIPHPQTPLANEKIVDANKVYKTIALSRLIGPEAKILVTSALETIDLQNGKRSGLLSGANSLMINITPSECKQLYSIYPNRAGNQHTVEENIKNTLELLCSIGRAPTDLGRRVGV
ncbi:[FeFe] hydrogenase H-cluster radical SAM maturase HydE [Candidatus Woesearchaeota archaeon]|nr:[FeFe] hydrogenase H-cluster radical SAM maturase HydE [Candidatus Woesearchaeota archaeon]